MNLFSRARCVSVARAGRRKRALMVQHPKYDLSEEIKRDQPTLLTRVFSSITRIKKVGNAGARICLTHRGKNLAGEVVWITYKSISIFVPSYYLERLEFF